jgi:hypothetical protein
VARPRSNNIEQMARTSPSLLTCSFLLTAFVLVVSVGASDDGGANDLEPERGMERLLGREGAKLFVDTVFGRDQPHFIAASSSSDSDSTDLLWSLELSEYYLNNDGGTPWKFEEGKQIQNGIHGFHTAARQLI